MEAELGRELVVRLFEVLPVSPDIEAARIDLNFRSYTTNSKQKSQLNVDLSKKKKCGPLIVRFIV